MSFTRGNRRRALVALSLPLVLGMLGQQAASATPAPTAKVKVRPAVALADAPLPFSFTTTGWTFADIAVGLRPEESSIAPPLIDTRPHDANGVRKFVSGGVVYDHPQGQAALALSMLDGYRLTKDKRYLAVALANANRLLSYKVVDTSVIDDGAWFFPYRFSFMLHGYPAETMRGPWYSGMAQGQILQLFSRLSVVTGDASWRDAADHTFASFLIAKRTGAPWVVEHDSDGYVWLEEYASPTGTPTPDHTFNGHNFAAAGLYDYAQLSKDPRAEKLLDGALTATLARIPKIHQTGWVSHYCFAHPEILNTKYHAIHIGQMLWFHQMTGDVRFARWADQLMADYPTSHLTGRVVVLARGYHRGYRFDSHGKLLGSVLIRLSRSSNAPIDQRARIFHRAGYYYEVTKGSLKGTWVKEVAGNQYLNGTLTLIGYRIDRTLAIPAATRVSGVTVTSGTGIVARSSMLSFATATQLQFDARGFVNGAERLRVSAGAWKGWWFLASQVAVDPPTA